MRLEDLPVQLAADAVAPERVVGGVDVVRLVLEREFTGLPVCTYSVWMRFRSALSRRGRRR